MSPIFSLVQGAPTGAAIIEVTPDAENYLVLAISPGTELTAQQVDTAIARANATVIVTQLDLPPEPVTTALAQSRPQTLRIGNLVPHPALDTSLLRYLDVLVVNQHEASTILNVDDVDPQAAADQLRRLGPSAAVVTTGARGAAYSHYDRSGTVAAPKVPATDTTGAGDAFLGSLALDLANNVRLADAISRAVQVGTEAVQHQGALLPPLLAPHNAAGSDTGGIAGMEPDAKASPRSKS